MGHVPDVSGSGEYSSSSPQTTSYTDQELMTKIQTILDQFTGQNADEIANQLNQLANDPALTPKQRSLVQATMALGQTKQFYDYFSSQLQDYMNQLTTATKQLSTDTDPTDITRLNNTIDTLKDNIRELQTQFESFVSIQTNFLQELEKTTKAPPTNR